MTLAPPKIEGSSDTAFITTSVKSPVTLECPFSGRPIPVFTWFKNGIPVIPGYFQNFVISKDGSEFTLLSPDLKDSGNYVCLATNSAGNDSRSFVLNVLGNPFLFFFMNLLYLYMCVYCEI